MAFTNTGAGATTPSNPDYRFALHTREGVGDRSGIASELGKQIDYSLIGQGVEAGGKLATEVYQGYQLGKLQKDITEKVVNPFIDSMGNSQNIAIATHDIEQSAYNQQEASIFNQLGQGGSSKEFESNIAANAASVKKSSDRLQAALKQGQMSQQEFELRLNATIREAINKNPGMTQELIAHGQNVAAMSGIRMIPDVKNEVDKEAAAAQKRQLNFEYSQHARVNTFIDPTRYENDPEYRSQRMSETEEKLRGQNYLTQLKQGVDTNELMSKEEAKENVPKMGAATQAVFTDIASAVSALAANAKTPQDKANIASQAETYAANALVQYRSDLTKNNFPRQHINDHINMLEKMSKNIIGAIQSDTSGKSLADVLNTQVGIQSAATKLHLNSKYNVDGFKLLYGMASPSVRDHWDRMQRTSPNKDRILNGLLEMSSGFDSMNALDAVIGKNIDPNRTDAVTAFKGVMESKDYENAEKIVQGINLHTVQNKDKNFATPSDLISKLEAQESLISEIGKSEYKGKLNFGQTMSENATNIVRDYLIDASTLFRREVDKINNEPTSKNYNVKLSTKLENGQLKIIGEGVDIRGLFNRYTGQQIADGLQKKYGEAFNRGVRAMSNLHNTNWEQGSKQLLDAIDQDWYLPEGQGSLYSKERSNYIDKVIKVESNGIANAKNPNSSATGVGQFISSTWNQMIDKYAPELKQGRTPEEVLALRNDPNISREMTNYLAQDNAKVLKQNSIPVNDTNLYLSHFLGASTAAMVLRVPDKVKLDDLLDEGVLEANSSVLKGRTVGDLKKWANRKMGG